jgi:hypothetical protein
MSLLSATTGHEETAGAFTHRITAITPLFTALVSAIELHNRFSALLTLGNKTRRESPSRSSLSMDFHPAVLTIYRAHRSTEYIIRPLIALNRFGPL